MHMHVLVLRLFEPVEHITKTSGELPDPSQIVMQSKAALETLIRLYYLRHGFEAYDPAMILFVSLLGWSALREYRKMTLEPDHQPHLEAVLSTLVLCAKFMRDQGSNHFLPEVVFHLFRSSMPSKNEARLLQEISETDEQASRVSLMVQEVRSEWPVGIFSLAKVSVEDARLNRFLAWCDQTMEDPLQRLVILQNQDPPDSPDAGWTRYPS
jgi:hypothetical protein